MKAKQSRRDAHRPRKLSPAISVAVYRAYYWMKADLVDFARRLGLPSHGSKPELSARIERRLRGLPDVPDTGRTPPKSPRDSAKPLERRTPVVRYRSDEKTRAFFESQIGRHFRFTYHLNQFRLGHQELTYGELVDEWLAEYQRRKAPDYKAPIARHGEYNRHIRDFFADKANQGKSLRDAVASWNKAKRGRDDRSYRPKRRSG